MSQQRLWQGGG
ncbi:succinylglutamic semialdehyde dehydrogenase, partial [Yersinia pestis PY-45]